MFFKCKHPAAFLVVEKDSTTEYGDDDFDYITHHLHCLKCGKSIDIPYAKTKGGIDAFIERGRKANKGEDDE